MQEIGFDSILETMKTLLIKTILFVITALLIVLILLGIRDSCREPDIGLVCNADFIITELVSGGAALDSGFQISDEIIAINGDPVLSGDRIATLGRKLLIGQSITYLVRRNSEELEITLTVKGPDSGSKRRISVNGAVYIIMIIAALVLNIRRSGYPPALLFFCLVICTLFFRMDHPRWPNATWGRLYQITYLFGFFILPALFAHFCARFPKPNYFVYQKKYRMLWFYIPSVTLFIPAAVTHWIHFRDIKSTELIKAMILFQGFIIWAILLTLGTLMMFRSYFRVRSRILARRCALVFYTIFLAVLPSLTAGLLDIFDRNFNSGTLLSTFLFLPLPLALAWAIDYGEDKREGLPWMFQRFFEKSD